MGKETTEQGAIDKEQKTFTQEEVNSIVQARLNREKNQVSKEAEAEYTQKLAELNAREMKLLVKEQLDNRNMSRKIADIITCTNEEDLKQKLDILEEIYCCLAH